MILALPRSEFIFPSSAFYGSAAVSSRRYHGRGWKRRRRRLSCQLSASPSSFGSLFHGLVSQFPFVSDVSCIAPALGLASGLAFYFSYKPPKLIGSPEDVGDSNPDIGEWILFSSPTPFNRFVTLRCASICFPGSELLENVNERLVEEDRHYVNVNCGRMVQGKSEDHAEGRMVYQRVCVGTEDGGVLSLDWPVNLELEEERGLDSTVFIVPGTSEGSNETKIKGFVYECLRRGLFPVVMNPRGCAGSPVTSPRLFTAADSDDISTAIQFIHKKRPWTTFLGVGWGYGANMLTKYLAEFGEKTPLTAVTCIDNPFDLEEASRSYLYNAELDQSLTKGLVAMLQCNKELFQGRGKGFDVERALSASSMREFDKAISMVSYGFDAIEDFYGKSSTAEAVGKVKIPVLFIQNDDGTLPLLSTPRSLISENPYTSLLLCSYHPSSRCSGSTFLWCFNVIVEWLTAVELGLLKGRHPLLDDVDVSINPSKGYTSEDGRGSNRSDAKEELLNLTNGYSASKSVSRISKAYDMTEEDIRSRFAQEIEWLPPETAGLHVIERKKSDGDAEVKEVEGANSVQNERGQAQQTAQVLINMLDATVPDTLSEEQKKKVLHAVGQGEMLMKAFQDSVPEDVREKLTSSISKIVENHGSNLKFDELLKLGVISDVTSGLSTKLREKNPFSRLSGVEEVGSSDQRSSSEFGDGSAVDGNSSDMPHRSKELENQPSQNLEKYNSQLNGDYGSGKDDLRDSDNNSENGQFSSSNLTKTFDSGEDMPEVSVSKESSSPKEGPGGSQDISRGTNKVEKEFTKGQSDLTENNSEQNSNFSTDQNKVSEANLIEGQSSSQSSSRENQVMENEPGNNQKKEGKDPQHVSSQMSDTPPSFNMSQAFDALNGFDDSTQVAVNSMFQVLGGMIDQLDVKKEDDNHLKDSSNKLNANDMDKIKNLKDDTAQLKDHDDDGLGKVNDLSNNLRITFSNSNVPPEGSDEEPKPHNTHDGYHSDAFRTNEMKYENGAMLSMVKNWNKLPGIPGHFRTFPYGDPLHREYLKAYLLSVNRNAKLLDIYKKSALHLDYFPEDGQWKLLAEMKDDCASRKESNTHNVFSENDEIDTLSISTNANNIIQPSLVVLDSGEQQKQTDGFEETNMSSNRIDFGHRNLKESMLNVRGLVIECLNIEVARRVSGNDVEELELILANDIEYVANVVSMATRQEKERVSEQNGHISEVLNSIQGGAIIRAISFATQNTQYLKRILPLGVVVGSILASLRKFFDVFMLDGNAEKGADLYQVDKLTDHPILVGKNDSNVNQSRKIEDENSYDQLIAEEEDKLVSPSLTNKTAMIGAVTAAVGASAFLIHHQNTQTDGTFMEPLEKGEKGAESLNIFEVPEKIQNNISSFAEKAMSVASPVVPTTENGEVDQDRLVAMLAELGQKGGILKLVGKVALLWGGIRGAMSLTDKLISFLRIAERPLLQRILGFIFMVLVLWSPVIIPLFPSLMQSWTSQNQFKIVELACISGLYVSTMIMVMLWGKRIRKYDDPVLQYGLDLISVPKFLIFLKGFTGGAVLVLLIHAVNSSLGFVQLCWPSTMYSFHSEPVSLVKSYVRMLLLMVQGIVTATGVVTVEELLFRSWLPQEIATDVGYHRGILLSGLAFSLCQRSIWEIPGLWLLSLTLSGAFQRSQGSLSLPIGIRSGILASNFLLKSGGFLAYRQCNLPLWLTGAHPGQLFSGVVGLAFSLSLAIVMYPRQPLHKTKVARTIRA